MIAGLPVSGSVGGQLEEHHKDIKGGVKMFFDSLSQELGRWPLRDVATFPPSVPDKALMHLAKQTALSGQRTQITALLGRLCRRVTRSSRSR